MMIDSIDYLLNEDTPSDIQILQANLAKSRIAHKQTLDHLIKNNIDLIAISEPFFDSATSTIPFTLDDGSMFENNTVSSISVISLFHPLNPQIGVWWSIQVHTKSYKCL